jgi:hypothetical protein
MRFPRPAGKERLQPQRLSAFGGKAGIVKPRLKVR